MVSRVHCLRCVALAAVWALAGLLADVCSAQEPSEDRDVSRPSLPVRRPLPRPGEPASMNAPDEDAASEVSEAQFEDEFIVLDAQDEELGDVIKRIGLLTGKNFDVSPDVGAIRVTIISGEEKIHADLAYRVLESILASRGYSLVPTLDGKLIKVQPTGDLSDKWDVVTDRKKLPDGYDTWSTYIVSLLYTDAEELVTLLKRVGSKSAQVDAFVKTNTLIISDTADGVRNMLTLIEELDKAGYGVTTEMFILEYAQASEVAILIEDVLLGPEGAVPAAGRPTPPRPSRPVRPRTPREQESVITGTREETLRLVPYDRLNALIVVAAESLMGDVRDLIDMIDTPTEIETGNLHIHPLQNADGEKLASALEEMIGAATPRRGRAGVQQAAEQTAEVQPFEKEVQITHYEPTNSLLILAAPEDFQRLEQIIAQLDVPPRQVHVEAIILEVVINDRYSLNVEAADLTANDMFALNNVVQLANLLSQGALGAGGPGLVTGILDGTTQITVAGAQGEAPSVRTIPNIPLLMTALENMTDVDVLSQPSLTTIDNEPARISVGQNVPVVGGAVRSQDLSAATTSAFSTRVEREDVGILMSVTPQISEGDYVAMEISVTVSQTIASPVGADPNLLGPTFQKSEIENKIVVKDGSTGIMGGLVSETTDHSVIQTPILGDVPLIGWLFRNKGDKRSKRNLVLLVTPHIIKEGVDTDRITTYKLDEFRTANVDVLFEKGFIKRIKHKRTMRRGRGASRARLDRLQAGEGLERGSM